jgi:predicted RNA-binding protein with PIN domain
LLYLFDGYNLLNAGDFRSREELVDLLAGWVALSGGRGVVVFDGAGEDTRHGPLEVRFALTADHLLERLAAASRDSEAVVLVSSDREIRQTVGQEVSKRESKDFAAQLRAGASVEARDPPAARSRIEDALDEETRQRLERFRRRRS